MPQIPKVDYAIIGGSSTNSINFPEDLKRDDVTIKEEDLVFETPFGTSPSFKLVQLDDKQFLTCKMHGWRPNVVTRGVASQQVFWVFKKAGVKKIYAEGGVGSINHLLELRDLVIPNDYIDQSQRTDVGLGGPYLLAMREAICPTNSTHLYEAARKEVGPLGRYVFNRGIYVNTDGRHFESPAEVQAYKQWGGDIIGQSITPEVYLAREIGACYAGIYMVVNYAEGIRKDWEHKDLSNIFYEESHRIGNILLNALKETTTNQTTCNCRTLRTKTLLTHDGE